ncbi:MAG: hypothetical protein R2711_01930 [Acidimicrobiales bacterium]
MSPEAVYAIAAARRGQHGVDVVGGRHAEGAVEARQVAGIASDLVGVRHEHRAEHQLRVGVDGADGGPAHVARAPHDRPDPLIGHPATIPTPPPVR